MRHLLDVDELSTTDIEAILRSAEGYRSGSEGDAHVLAGAKVALLFAEPSTRTRLSFEVAARALGAQTFVLDPGGSSLVKGETLRDTARTLAALGLDFLVLRHHRAGAPWVVARHFAGHVVNAGDGWHAHPTQALLDLFTLERAMGGGAGSPVGALGGRKVVIVGDVRHSRVARSNLWTLSSAGAEVWACGPAAWLAGWLGEQTSESLENALSGADAVMALRVQRERMRGAALDLDDYIARYQVTEARMRLAKPGAVFLHPGPVNEGIEVTREVAVGPRSLVLEQVRNGVHVRMAVLAALAAGQDRRPGPPVRSAGLAPGPGGDAQRIARR